MEHVSLAHLLHSLQREVESRAIHATDNNDYIYFEILKNLREVEHLLTLLDDVVCSKEGVQ